MTNKINRFTKTTILTTVVVASLVVPGAAVYAASPDASSVAKSLSKAGLGCKDLKATNAKILYGGKRWTCTIKGVKTNLESYSSSNLKKVGKYMCDSGFDISTVTDGKSWVIASGNAAVDKSIAKALKFSVKKTCKY
jgi:hypothetical protein